MGLKKSLPRVESVPLHLPGQNSSLEPSPADSSTHKRKRLRDKLLDLAEPALEELSRQIQSPHLDPDTKRELALQILRDSGVSVNSRNLDDSGSSSPGSLPALSDALISAFKGLGVAFGIQAVEKLAERVVSPPSSPEESSSLIPFKSLQQKKKKKEQPYSEEAELPIQDELGELGEPDEPEENLRIPGLKGGTSHGL